MRKTLLLSWLLVAGLPLAGLNGSDEETAELDPAELEKRRQALRGWTREPVAIETPAFRLHMDRHDGSFFVDDYRGGTRWLSSWRRRGFASVRLAGGECLPIDRVEALNAEERKIRFRGASSMGTLPPMRFEIRAGPEDGVLRWRFEVEEPGRDRVDAVRLLDDALWVADADGDGSGVAVARGLGEWYGASADGAFRMRLEGLSPFTREPAEGYSIPLVGVLKGEAALLLCWESPEAAVEVERRKPDGNRFPGSAGLFTSLEFPGPEGELSVLPLGRHRVGIADAARFYRDFSAQRLQVHSLRYKTGFDPNARPSPRTLLGAVFFRPTLLEPPQPPWARGRVRFSFADLGDLAEHWKRELEIEEAVLLLEGWVGGASDDELLAPATELGGRDGLMECVRRVREAGYLLGLSVDRDHLIVPAREMPPPDERAWQAALEGARRDDGFAAVKERYSPQLLVITESRGSLFTAEALQARAELAGLAAETFGLYGSAPGSEADVETASYLEGLLSDKIREPTSQRVFPFFSAVYGQAVRLATARGEGLGPEDAAGFLAHLICGETPSYRVPGPAYFKEAGSAEGAAAAGGCFARADGWTGGKGWGPFDVFLKNTSEIATPFAHWRARNSLLSHRFLTADGSVQESYFGVDLRVVVNFGSEPYTDDASGCVLPQYGFVIRHPFFYAFHALAADDLAYERPAFFTVRSLGSKMYLRAEKTRIYHGFGPPQIRLGGRTHTVERAEVLRLW